MDKKNLGSSFEAFLREEGTYEDTTARAIKRVLARQIAQAMKDQGLSKSAMARRMETSRPALERLLDPQKPGGDPQHPCQGGTRGRQANQAGPGLTIFRQPADKMRSGPSEEITAEIAEHAE